MDEIDTKKKETNGQLKLFNYSHSTRVTMVQSREKYLDGLNWRTKWPKGTTKPKWNHWRKIFELFITCFYEFKIIVLMKENVF